MEESDTEWRAAVDSKTQRVYYYNKKTRETTWTKPMELCSEAEREALLRKKQETLAFFEEMEANIRNKVRMGKNSSALNEVESSSGDHKDEAMPTPMQRRDSFGQPTRYVRTISSMDDELLEMLKRSSIVSSSSSTVLSDRDSQCKSSGSSARNGIRGRSESKDESKATNSAGISQQMHAESKYIDDSGLLRNPLQNPPARKARRGMRRRNSTGTIYVATTMSQQNNEATIRCVCVVIRAHMVEAARENIVPIREFDVFLDAGYRDAFGRRSPLTSDADAQAKLDASGDVGRRGVQQVPSLAVVEAFFNQIFSKSQLESECIIMALIYCERLVKETKGRLCIRFDNWRSILFACMVMASKVWDDMSMWNVDFSQICPSFDLTRVNELELAMLNALKFTIKVPASEYAKYYFHLRSMMARLGLHEHEPNRITPLDLAGARKLQLATETYAESQRFRERAKKRSTISGEFNVSVEGLSQSLPTGGRHMSSDAFDYGIHGTPVVLEQLLHKEHVDADGRDRTLRKKERDSGQLDGVLDELLRRDREAKASASGGLGQHK